MSASNRQYPPTAETQTKKWFQFDETLKIEARFAWAVGVGWARVRLLISPPSRHHHANIC